MALLDELLGMGGQGISRGTPYQSGGVNPQLMQMLASLTGPRMTPTPTPGVPGGSAVDMQIDELLKRRYEPEPFTPVDVPNAPTTLQKVLASIADAAGMYAGGLNPMIGPVGASRGLADQSAARQEAIRFNEEGKRLVDFRARMAGDEAKLRQLLGQKEAEGKAADRKYTEGVKAADIKREDERAALKRTQDLQDITDAFERQKQIEKIKGDYDLSQARIQQGQRNKDKVADDEAEKLGKARAYIVALADQVPVMLAGGREKNPRDEDDTGVPAMTADQIRTRISRAFDVIMGPTGDARSAADAYAKLIIDQQIDEYLRAEGQGPKGQAEVKPKILSRNDPGAPLRGFEGR